MNSNFCTEIKPKIKRQEVQHSFYKNSVGNYNPPHYRNENNWENIPETETERLQKTLYNHSKKIIPMSKSERIQFVKEMLEKQNNTCVFGKNVNGKWCWNESKVNFKNDKYVELKYIKLQWGHIKPRCRKESQTINDLYLLCARCNNQIQTSRHLIQIPEELESKILHINQFLQEQTGTFKSTTSTKEATIFAEKKAKESVKELAKQERLEQKESIKYAKLCKKMEIKNKKETKSKKKIKQ